jgi:hypothetical protein
MQCDTLGVDIAREDSRVDIAIRAQPLRCTVALWRAQRSAGRARAYKIMDCSKKNVHHTRVSIIHYSR